MTETPVTKPFTPAVASPCTSVCTIDPISGYCAGCMRTLDEIAGWVRLTDDEKRLVLAELPARRAQLDWR